MTEQEPQDELFADDDESPAALAAAFLEGALWGTYTKDAAHHFARSMDAEGLLAAPSEPIDLSRCTFTRDGSQCVVSTGHETGHLLEDGSPPIEVASIRDDRTPDKDEQRQALPARIWEAIGAERNRGERHADETPTGDLVDAVMLPVDEYADGLHDDLEDDNERLRADLARADAACIEARAHRGEAVAENDRLRDRLAAAEAKLAVYEAIPDLCTCKARRGVVHVRGARAAAACEHAETAAAQPSTVAEQLRYQASHSEHGSQFHAENERRLRAELATARKELAALNGKLGERGGTIFELSQENARLRAAQPSTVTAGVDLLELAMKQGRDQAARSAGLRRPVPAEAGDSTRFQFKLGDRVRNRYTGSIFTVSEPLADWSEFYYERVEAGDSTTPSELQVAPSLGVGDSTAAETPEEASKRGQAILQEEVHGHRHDGNGIAESCMECREWADDMVHALTYCSLVIAPPVASPASSVRDTAETPNAPSEVAPSCCGTTSDCTETQCFCEPDTCGHVGENPGGAA
jgi:hypothetical protein